MSDLLTILIAIFGGAFLLMGVRLYLSLRSLSRSQGENLDLQNKLETSDLEAKLKVSKNNIIKLEEARKNATKPTNHSSQWRPGDNDPH